MALAVASSVARFRLASLNFSYLSLFFFFIVLRQYDLLHNMRQAGGLFLEGINHVWFVFFLSRVSIMEIKWISVEECGDWFDTTRVDTEYS